MGVLFGVVMAAVGFLGARTFLTWMSTPSDVIDQASLYLQIYFCGTPAFMRIGVPFTLVAVLTGYLLIWVFYA